MIEALLEAVQNALRVALVPHIPGEDASKAPFYCAIHPEGHPPETMGDWYVSIDEAAVESTEKAFIREVFRLEVYITKRTGKYATDRQRTAYLQALYGLGPLERTVATTIHNSHSIRAAACMLAGVPDAAAGDIFQHPLWYQGRQRTRPYGADWVRSTRPKPQDTFLVRTLPFRGGTRVQAMDIAG